MFFDNESSVGAMVTAVRSDAQDDGKERAEETAATVTGTFLAYATPMESLGQPSLSRLRKPGRGNRKIRFVKRETRSEIERERAACWSRILLPTQEKKRKGLNVKFGCGLSGDEGQLFRSG
jgi:hypothetical protein